MLPQVGIEPGPLIASDSKSNTILSYTNFACKTETLGFLYSNALWILLKPSKTKHQVVHEQKFKDLLSSTCQHNADKNSLFTFRNYASEICDIYRNLDTF